MTKYNKIIQLFFVIIGILLFPVFSNAQNDNSISNPYINCRVDSIDLEIEFDIANYKLLIAIYNDSKSTILLDTSIIYKNVTFNSQFGKISFEYSNNPDRMNSDIVVHHFGLVSISPGNFINYEVQFSDFERILETKEVPTLSFGLSYIRATKYSKSINELKDLNYIQWMQFDKQFILLERNL